MCLVVLLSFHEYAHAWMAHKCGDDTARIMGRMTINPIVHIDLLGTVFLPLMMLMLGPSFMFFGWAKPVPVNPANLSNRKRDDILISMAGPAMNLILAFVLLAILRLLAELPASFSESAIVEELPRIITLSLVLCVFNLMPIPPLDGSHVMRHMVGMSEETYRNIASFGFIILIIVINIPYVWMALSLLVKLLLTFMQTILFFP